VNGARGGALMLLIRNRYVTEARLPLKDLSGPPFREQFAYRDQTFHLRRLKSLPAELAITSRRQKGLVPTG